MGKPCIVGASEMKIDVQASRCICGSTVISDGDTITIDGSTGAVYVQSVPTIEPKVTEDFQKNPKLGIKGKKDRRASKCRYIQMVPYLQHNTELRV